MSDIGICVFFCIITGLIGIWAGGDAANRNIRTDCDKIGATVIRGIPYDCKERRP